MAADGGVRTGRLPGVAVGVSEPTSGDGGVNTGVVSDSGAGLDGVGSGTTVPDKKNTCLMLK